ncbi:5078_t:CDS:2 [Funneliformis mosseae]|uniref:5078_t:CDS:1 n=1 Tax=Funneliformis mosseae TaxID=27381 RepID=A0A9N9DKV9_FUNMO|nr:5078_t:CDS:2 [Funneliformis mosseae]
MGCLEISANATTSLVCAVTSFENVPETETLSFVPATGGSGEIDTWSKAGALDAPGGVKHALKLDQLSKKTHVKDPKRML